VRNQDDTKAGVFFSGGGDKGKKRQFRRKKKKSPGGGLQGKISKESFKGRKERREF